MQHKKYICIICSVSIHTAVSVCVELCLAASWLALKFVNNIEMKTSAQVVMQCSMEYCL